MNKWVNRKLDKKRTTGKGFTLIELIVVVTVLGILAAIVIYAVGNITGAATKSAAGTTGSEVTQAEQAYCQANGVYGNLQQLTQGGYLTNPNPNLVVYTWTVPSSGQYFNACSTSGSGGAGSVYDAYPQTITQPDGTLATIPTPPAPSQVLGADSESYPGEILGALGVIPAGGAGSTTTPLLTMTGYNADLGGCCFNYPAYAAAKPSLIIGDNFPAGWGLADTQQFEAIAPMLSFFGVQNHITPTNPQALDLSLLSWVPMLVAVADVMNLQVQAAEFLTAFQNAAAAVEPQLAGKSVSVIVPLSAADNGPALEFEGIAGNGTNQQLLQYLGMNVVCPNCAAGTNNRYDMPLANVSASTVTAQYLIIEEDGYAPDNQEATTLFGPGGTYVSGSQALPQATGGTGGTSDICGPTTETWGIGCTDTLASVTPTLPYPLTNYCSTAGVAQSQVDANVNTSQSVLCPYYTSQTSGGVTTYTYSPPNETPTTGLSQYTTQPVPGGIGIGGPITALAAIPYIASEITGLPSF